MSKAVEVEISEGIATLSFNRPKALNALNAALVDDLVEAASRAEFDEAVRCVVLRGEGDHFMAGGDIKFFLDTLGDPAAERRILYEAFIDNAHRAIVAFRRMPKPVIASVRGAAAGGGLGFAVCCDIAIAADDAQFTFAYNYLGTAPDSSTSYHLPRQIGLRRALGMAFLNEPVDAQTALAWGLVNKVVPAAELDAATREAALKIANGATKAFAATKRLMMQSQYSQLEAQLKAEATAFAECTLTEDFAEGVNAFVEKRKPDFKGR
ncbi:MAG: enoyl-CoA hydratase/isomerase family protein [Alphaproteobacteria bacterium]